MEWLRSGRQRREFERLVAEATEGLRRTAYLMTWDAQEADDLVQVTWTTVARRWPRVSQMENPVAYARRVLTNAVIDGRTQRQRRRQELATADGDTRDVVDVASGLRMAAVDDQQDLRRALATLTVRQRTVLVLRYWEDLTEQEVADLLGCSVGTVKSTASRALAHLRAQLHPERTP
ncbi:MAG: SigE family RNA polymerase sigma factor [Micromonosporaceae bacterium]|nr:SigE family RNA polymerase sigma factor [Micromonosporaceae bacterium]